MAYEVKTVRIENPDNVSDYIVIAEADFDPKINKLFRGDEGVPAVPTGPPPEDLAAGLIAEGLDITVAKLGPWLQDQTSMEMLVRLQDQETRRSALALIKSRIETLKKE